MTITATSIGLSWSAPASGGTPTAYAILYRVTGSGAFSILADGVTGTSYTAAGLVSTVSYDFAVYARNNAGPGPLSGIVTAATLGAVPNAPASLTVAATAPAYGSFSLSWPAPATDGTHGAASGYQVYQRLTSVGGSWGSPIANQPGTTLTVTGLAHNTGYDFDVVPYNVAGPASSGAVASGTTDYAPPNAPAAPTVAPVNDGTTTKLTVTWAAPTTDGTHDAATGYDLQYRTSPSGSWTVVTGATSPYAITGLTTGTAYDVQVRGKNASTTSPGAWSSSTTVSTYSTVMSWNTQTTPITHGSSGNIFNLHTTPNPGGTVGVNFWWSTSAATNTMTGTESTSRTSGGTDNGYPIMTNVWGAYIHAPSTAGTYYLWGIVGDNSGCIVSEAITVT